MKDRLIFLVRHAEPGFGDEIKRYLGQSDLDLSQKGILQAQTLAHAFRNQKIRDIYCSTLIRTEHTAKIIAKEHNCNPIRIKDLKEINMGEWEGISFNEVKSLFPEEYEKRGKDIVNYCPPGGESFAEVSKRVIPSFNNIIQNSEGNIVIVGHAGVNRVILCHLMKLPMEKLLSIKQDYTGVNTILKNDNSYNLKFINKVF